MTCARTQTLSHAGRCDVERLGEQSSPCLIALFHPFFCLSNSVDCIQSPPQEWILRVTSMRIKLSLLKSHAAAATTKRHLTRNGVSICTPYSPCSTSPSLVSLYTSMRTLTVANGKLLAGIQNCMTHEAPSCMKSVHTLEPSHTTMRSNKPLKSTIAPFSSLGRRAHKLTMRGNISYTVRVERRDTLLSTVTNYISGEFPVMTEEEAAPFGSELQPMPEDHKYHLEYVLRTVSDCIKLIPLTINTDPICSTTYTASTPCA